MLKIGIVGSREFFNKTSVRKTIYNFIQKLGKDNIEIVSGEQPKGADGYAKKYALEFEVKYISFPPAHYNYNQYCIKEAYEYGKEYKPYYFFQRNTEIAEYSDIIIAFIPRGTKLEDSRGTNDTYQKALKLGKKVFLMN